MNLGEFEPDVWVPAAHPAAARGTIGLEELARLDVVYGPRRVSAETYDAWLAVLRAANARFEFIDPPFRHSLPITLAFAAAGSRPTAVLTGPRRRTTTGTAQAGPDRSADTHGMVPVRVKAHPLTAMAGLAWSAAIVVLGDPGIGKSSLLRAAADHGRAAGLRVLAATGIEAEAHLPYAGLHHLLRPVLSAMNRLPAIQAGALSTTFGMSDGPPPEPFMIALATLNLLTATRTPSGSSAKRPATRWPWSSCRWPSAAADAGMEAPRRPSR